METRAGRFSGRWIPALIPGVLTALAAWPAAAQGPDPYFATRIKMVRDVVEADGVTNKAVLKSMRSVPRHLFCRPADRKLAYRDGALPIGFKQTISPPFVVAYMTQTIDPQPTDRVLEIGTGSGYQAAILSGIVKEVYTIEIVPQLGKAAAARLKALGYANVQAMVGDGYKGWPEKAPFDKIIVTCSPEKVPQALIDQLKDGGKLLIPLGERYQQVFHLYEKKDGKLTNKKLIPTLFVPMTGISEERRAVKPDPANPKIVNGSFENAKNKAGRPDNWHYQRKVKLVSGQAPDGKQYVSIVITDPGQRAQMLQGMAIDGRLV
jgi:protein-L-isoaspartate(D-aspartate) O-methyltransferase